MEADYDSFQDAVVKFSDEYRELEGEGYENAHPREQLEYNKDLQELRGKIMHELPQGQFAEVTEALQPEGDGPDFESAKQELS